MGTYTRLSTSDGTDGTLDSELTVKPSLMGSTVVATVSIPNRLVRFSERHRGQPVTHPSEINDVAFKRYCENIFKSRKLKVFSVKYIIMDIEGSPLGVQVKFKHPTVKSHSDFKQITHIVEDIVNTIMQRFC